MAEPGQLKGSRVAVSGRCAGTPSSEQRGSEQSDRSLRCNLFVACTVLAGFQLIVILLSSFSFSFIFLFLFPVYGTSVATLLAQLLLLPGAVGDQPKTI
jgi:hypothetical protein